MDSGPAQGMPLDSAAPTAVSEPAAQPADAPQLREARDALLRKPSTAPGAIILVVSLVLFVLAARSEESTARDLVILVAVLLLHELGHLAAMRLFGYADLSIFFIPFFGAAASGRKRGAPGWQQAIVSLAGPVPGLALAWILMFVGLAFPSDLLHAVGSSLLLVNGFNLLPMYPLDGGRLFELTLFSRHPVLETAFRIVAVLLLGLAALAANAWILTAFAFFMLLGIPRGHRESRAAHQLRTAHPDFPSEPEKVDDEGLRALLQKAQTVLPSSAPAEAGKQRGEVVRALYERVLHRPPGALASVLLLFVWSGAILGTLLGVVLMGYVESRLPGRAVLEDARGLYEKGEYAAASGLLDQCRAFQGESANKYSRLRCEALLGSALEQQGLHAEAAAVLSKALESKAAASSSMSEEVREVLEMLARAKEGLGQQDEAQALRARAAAMAAQ